MSEVCDEELKWEHYARVEARLLVVLPISCNAFHSQGIGTASNEILVIGYDGDDYYIANDSSQFARLSRYSQSPL